MSEQYVSEAYTHLLQPDTVLPSQYYAALRRKTIQEPERRLVIAILEDAVDCYVKHMFSSDRRSQQLFLDAEEWFADDDREWPFAFENVCEFLGLEPGYMRNGLKALKEREHTRRASAKAVGPRAAA
jgi:hypothetical protein